MCAGSEFIVIKTVIIQSVGDFHALKLSAFKFICILYIFIRGSHQIHDEQNVYEETTMHRVVKR